MPTVYVVVNLVLSVVSGYSFLSDVVARSDVDDYMSRPTNYSISMLINRLRTANTVRAVEVQRRSRMDHPSVSPVQNPSSSVHFIDLVIVSID